MTVSAHTNIGVINMIDNRELPIGFTMELAMHSDILNRFSHLSKQEQDSVIDGARQVTSHNQMRDYVESMFDDRNSRVQHLI